VAVRAAGCVSDDETFMGEPVEIDEGARTDTTTADAARIAEPGRENRELGGSDVMRVSHEDGPRQVNLPGIDPSALRVVHHTISLR
jgi:hypothetical protein